MKLLALPIALMICSPAMADGFISFPIAIPQECVTVAQRVHVPTVMRSKYEAVQAAQKLDRMSDRDPSVSLCKQTVARLKAYL